MYFSRQKSINVSKEDNNNFISVVTFVDEYHNFELKITSDIDLTILDSEIKILNMPYETCSHLKEIVKKVIGIKVARGLTKQANILMGGSEGCVHMVDMFLDATRGLVQARLKYIEETSGMERFYEELRGSCISYK